MANNTKSPSENTELFALLPEPVATLMLTVIHSVFSVLRWRRSSKSLLAEILDRISETEFFELTHDDFSAAICPDQAQSRRVEKMSRWIAKLKEDMKLSGFQATWIENRRTRRNEDGAVRGLPTMYKRGAFWKLFRYVQDMALEIDLLSLPVNRRRAQVRAIVAQWLKESGATPIERAKKTDEIKPAKPSLPCSCACVSCSKCAAKAPAPIPLNDEPVVSVQIENEKQRFIEIERDFVSIGTAMLNRGTKLSIVDSKLNNCATAARVELKAAVARKAGRGSDYAPDTETRAHGRAALELAIEGLRDAQKAAAALGRHQHAAKLEEFWQSLEQWEVFSNRAGISFEGGPPK